MHSKRQRSDECQAYFPWNTILIVNRKVKYFVHHQDYDYYLILDVKGNVLLQGIAVRQWLI